MSIAVEVPKLVDRSQTLLQNLVDLTLKTRLIIKNLRIAYSLNNDPTVELSTVDFLNNYNCYAYTYEDTTILYQKIQRLSDNVTHICALLDWIGGFTDGTYNNETPNGILCPALRDLEEQSNSNVHEIVACDLTNAAITGLTLDDITLFLSTSDTCLDFLELYVADLATAFDTWLEEAKVAVLSTQSRINLYEGAL